MVPVVGLGYIFAIGAVSSAATPTKLTGVSVSVAVHPFASVIVTVLEPDINESKCFSPVARIVPIDKHLQKEYRSRSSNYQLPLRYLEFQQ